MVIAGGLPAQDSAQDSAPTDDFDALFDAPAEDVQEQPTDVIDHTAQFEKTESMAVTGSFTATGVGGGGWIVYPDWLHPQEGFDGTVGLTSSATLALDARPDTTVRVYGSMGTSMDPLAGSASWPAPAIDELFCDYSGINGLFLRLGTWTLTWGQGRIFTPGNLVSDSAGNFIVRGSLPTLLNGVSFTTLMNNSLFSTPSSPSPRELVYAGTADLVLGKLLIGTGFRYQLVEGYNALVSLKIVLFGTDMYTDLTAHYLAPRLEYKALAGFFREWGDFKLNMEYCFDGTELAPNAHSLAVDLGYKDIFDTPVDIGAQWRHGLTDGSGSLALGLGWTIFPNVTATIGLPFIYGKDGSFYVEDNYNNDPAGRRLALGLSLELSASFR